MREQFCCTTQQLSLSHGTTYIHKKSPHNFLGDNNLQIVQQFQEAKISLVCTSK